MGVASPVDQYISKVYLFWYFCLQTKICSFSLKEHVRKLKYAEKITWPFNAKTWVQNLFLYLTSTMNSGSLLYKL